MTFPGECEVCGGPRIWTYIAGELYVACEDSQNHLLEELLPPVSEGDMGWPEEKPNGEVMEPSEKGGVGALEGSGPDGMDCSLQGVNEPPEGWLSTLWEGGAYESSED